MNFLKSIKNDFKTPDFVNEYRECEKILKNFQEDDECDKEIREEESGEIDEYDYIRVADTITWNKSSLSFDIPLNSSRNNIMTELKKYLIGKQTYIYYGRYIHMSIMEVKDNGKTYLNIESYRGNSKQKTYVLYGFNKLQKLKNNTILKLSWLSGKKYC